MLDWSKIRFAACRLCAGDFDASPPFPQDLVELGLPASKEERRRLGDLCDVCLQRCGRWFNRRADIRTLGETELDFDGEEPDDRARYLAEDLAAAVGKTRIRREEFGGLYATYIEFYRDVDRQISVLDVADFIAHVVKKKPRWLRAQCHPAT